MSIGGLFPLPITDLVFGGGTIALASGGTFYPPSGRYLLTTGQTTLLQTWDPIQLLWRNTTIPQIDSQIIACDGANFRLFNCSGTVMAAAITAAGSGGVNGIGPAQTGVTVSFAAPASPGLTATAYAIVGGQVVAPTVNQAGSGFLVPPLVLVDPPPPGGIQATAVATLTAPGGGLAGITMVNPGAGYIAASPGFYLVPQVNVYPGAPPGGFAAGAFPPPGIVAPQNLPPAVQPVYFGPGTAQTQGAQLNPSSLTGSGTLTGIVMMQNGSNYTGTTIPAITITGCGAAAATALMSLVMTGVSGITGGSGYTGSPPNFVTSLGDVVAAGATLSYNNNNTLDGRPARGVTTTSGGAVNGFVIEDPGFGFQKVPVIGIIETGAAVGTIAGATAVCGGITDTCLLQAKVTI